MPPSGAIVRTEAWVNLLPPSTTPTPSPSGCLIVTSYRTMTRQKSFPLLISTPPPLRLPATATTPPTLTLSFEHRVDQMVLDNLNAHHRLEQNRGQVFDLSRGKRNWARPDQSAPGEVKWSQGQCPGRVLPSLLVLLLYSAFNRCPYLLLMSYKEKKRKI